MARVLNDVPRGFDACPARGCGNPIHRALVHAIAAVDAADEPRVMAAGTACAVLSVVTVAVVLLTGSLLLAAAAGAAAAGYALAAVTVRRDAVLLRLVDRGLLVPVEPSGADLPTVAP